MAADCRISAKFCTVKQNRELYRIGRPCNYRGQQQLPDPAVAICGCCLRLKLHQGVLAQLIQVFTAVENELIKRL